MQTCHQVFSKSSYHYALGSAQTGSLSIGKTNMISVFLCMVTTGLMFVSPVPTCYRVICVHVTRKYYKKPLKPFCLRLTSGWRTLISTRTVSCHTRNSKRASRKPSVHISAHVDTKNKRFVLRSSWKGNIVITITLQCHNSQSILDSF